VRTVFTLKSLRLPRLLQSSIDAFEEAIDHYIEGTSKRNKSCVKSCDEANELILKAKVQNLGESIYVKLKRGRRHSLYLHESLDILENKKWLKIPERNKLKNIHKRRNLVYHAGETASRRSAKSTLKTTFNFIERFLRDEFSLELRDIVKPRYRYDLLDQNIVRKRSAVMMIDEGSAELHRLDEARSTIPREYERIEALLNWLAKKKKLKLGKQQLSSSSSSTSNRPSNVSSVRMAKIVEALIADHTLPEERRKDFDIISKLYDKAVNIKEEITGDDYDPYWLC
jgi:hypothetical protein